MSDNKYYRLSTIQIKLQIGNLAFIYIFRHFSKKQVHYSAPLKFHFVEIKDIKNIFSEIEVKNKTKNLRQSDTRKITRIVSLVIVDKMMGRAVLRF